MPCDPCISVSPPCSCWPGWRWPPRPPRLALDRDTPGRSTWPLAPLSIDPGDLHATRDEALGSNNWAVSASLTPDGHALVANDMHLAIRVPNTWYRASMEWPDAADAATPHRLIGTTLPGVPTLVTGSNTHVAWGFTNTYADWSDIVALNTDPSHPNAYRTPEGWRSFEVFDEVIDAAGGAPEHLPVRWTIWGPVLPADYRGRARAYRWTAHDAETLLSDPGTGRLYVATKGFVGGMLYAAPKKLRPDAPNRLRPIADVGAIVTDGSFFPDGRHLILRDYDSATVYEFPSMRQLGTFDLPDQRLEERGGPNDGVGETRIDEGPLERELGLLERELRLLHADR